MPTTKAEFQAVAAELFNEEFADFAPKRAFTKPASGGTYDPVTETITGGTPAVTEQIPCIREDYRAGQYDGVQIQIGDFKLLAQVSSFDAITPRTDGVTVDVDGVACQVITAEKDAADAVWTMQVRAL